MAGLLVSVGNRGGVVGTQSIIALVVFGRFSQPADQALGLATLVLAGGLAQVVVPQRRALAAAPAQSARRHRRGLPRAGLAGRRLRRGVDAARGRGDRRGRGQPGLPHAVRRRRRDHAAQPRQRGLPDARADHGHPRAAAPAERRGRRARRPRPTSPVRRALASTAAALDTAALAIQGDEDAFRSACCGAAPSSTPRSRPTAGGDPGRRRCTWTAGSPRWPDRSAPSPPCHRPPAGAAACAPVGPTRAPTIRSTALRADLEQMRANMSIRSPAGRHALRLAVIVPVAALIARELPAPAQLLDGGGGGHGPAPRVRRHLHARRRASAGHLPGRRAGRRHRGHASTRRAARPSSWSARWPGRATRCSRPASRSGSASSPRSWCSCSTWSAPTRWPPPPTGCRHARRRRHRPARLRAVANVGAHLGLAVPGRSRRRRARLRRRRAHRRGGGTPARRPADARAGTTGPPGPHDRRVHRGPLAV